MDSLTFLRQNYLNPVEITDGDGAGNFILTIGPYRLFEFSLPSAEAWMDYVLDHPVGLHLALASVCRDVDLNSPDTSNVASDLAE